MGFLPRDQLGLPLFCAAGNRERRLLAESFAPATGSGMDGKLPRLGARTTASRYPHTGILQPWICSRLSASSPTPRLGCNTLFGRACECQSSHAVVCLREK